MRRLSTALAVVCVLSSPAAARADVVLDWNAIAVNVTTSQGPFAQARLLAITQLAVFEAVNAVTDKYEPYLETPVVAPAGASANAAAIAVAHKVLKHYLNTVPGVAATLDAALVSSLAAIPDGPAKSGGISTGEAAADAMITLRLNDGSEFPEFYVPESLDPGVWQLTPSCTAGAGVFLHWRNVTPFGIRSVDRFISDPPPALTSRRYTKDYIEVKTVGSLTSTERPQDRADVARFYAASSPGFVLNTAAQQVSRAQGRSLSHNARADDVDDARVYGGIHFRFDQEAGAELARDVGGQVYRHNLQRDHDREHDREEDCDYEHDRYND